MTATNIIGETYSQTITVNYKSVQNISPINMTITSPTDATAINRSSIMVKGTVTTDADEVWVNVNGKLAEVYNGQFVDNHVPLVNGVNRLIVNAIDSNGAVGRAETTVRADTTAPYVDLNSNITSGIAPITSYFGISVSLPNAVVSYQMDFDGDGVVDYTGTDFEGMTYTYMITASTSWTGKAATTS